jgi:hypothetical protein
MNQLTPMSELEAVNMLLESIGEAPVNTIESGLSEAHIARQTLRQSSRKCQSRGWWFNTEAMTLTPDANREIQLPANCLKVETGYEHIVYRGSKLYDRANNTYAFEGQLRASLVLGLSFDELPEVARHYITVRAGRIFQDRTVGATSLHGFQKEDEQMAWHDLHETELENGNYNVFDNADVARSLNRSTSYKRTVFTGTHDIELAVNRGVR